MKNDYVALIILGAVVLVAFVGLLYVTNVGEAVRLTTARPEPLRTQLAQCGAQLTAFQKQINPLQQKIVSLKTHDLSRIFFSSPR